MTLLRPLVLSLTLAGGCSPSPPPARQAAAPAPDRTPAPERSDDHPACADAASAEKLVIARGQTARASFALAVTYGGLEHDSFEGGHTDSVATLTFRGVMDDGGLTPSAFSWRPSALARPSWVHLGSMPVCARVSDATPERLTLEVFRAPGRR